MFVPETSSFLLYLSILWTIDVSIANKINMFNFNPYDSSTLEYDYDHDKITTQNPNEEADLPANFDVRLKWSKICKTLKLIGNQGRCKSGWAMAISTVITDRQCIATLGRLQFALSPMMLLSCCPNCCGCAGTGKVLDAWKFVRDVGILTGSIHNYNLRENSDGCQPYMLKPLSKYDLLLSSTQSSQTPTCVKNQCTNPYYHDEKPIYHTINSFKLFSRRRPELIMRELMTNGPLQVSFSLYEDFRHYKADKNNCPIYIHIWGKYEGEHAGKLIGWGTNENKTKYWLVANSFGSHWGCRGTFRVPRNGKDNINFGYAIVAPQVYNNGFVAMTIDYFHVALVGLLCVVSITSQS